MVWNKSNHYIKYQNKLKELYRRQSDVRKYQHECLANKIISLGDNIYVEKMNFQGLAKRSTKTEKNKQGRYKRKKRFGKTIGNRAPSMLLGIIDRKLSYFGKNLIKIDTWSAKASQFNHFDGTYNKKKLSQRWNDFNGVKVQRDMYSAFLIMNTETVDGNLIHHYRQYTTEWVTEDNTPLKDKFTGKEVKDSGTIPNYKFLETKTDEKGNVKHIFAQFTTSWVDENNKNLAEPAKADRFKEEETFEGYKLINTKEEGRTKVYTYHKLTTEWVEENTNKQLKKQDGVHDHGDINAYAYVKTETKENGDLVHVFKKTEQRVEQKKEQKKDDIPTGVHSNGLISLLMILISSIGLALTNVIKKREF